MSEGLKSQADATGELDNLFRQTLDNHQIEPSKKIWKGISRKLLRAELSRFNFTNLHKSIWIGSACAFIFGLILLYNQIPDGKTTENDYNPIIINNKGMTGTTAASSKPVAVATRKGITGMANPTIQAFRNESSLSQSLLNAGSPALASSTSTNTFTKNSGNYATKIPSGFTSKLIIHTPGQSGKDHLIVSNNRSTNNYELNYMPALSFSSLFPSSEKDTMLRFTTLNGILNVPVRTNVQIPHFYTFNLGISPELSVYRNNGQYSSTNYWLNAGMSYHLGRFTIQSGLGLGYVYDHADYRVNYKSKDSIGYFTSIITFTVNPGNVIVYTTKDIAVYDSLQHIADDRALDRYTYLRIPLLIGFELFETNRLSIGIKAGPAISFLIGSKEASVIIDYPNARLIRIENNTLVRVKMNWEIQAALDIEYRLVKNFSLYAEPTYKHYFKPFETQESVTTKAKDPYSIGIEVGARFNFGKKIKHD
jgi:hypothetical protein